MKLHQHPDFRDAIIAAGKYFEPKGIANQLIEKDYYVTEALRTIANRWESQVIFKGGTSLSKGWQLIDRFSEDIDLFLNLADVRKKGPFLALFYYICSKCASNPSECSISNLGAGHRLPD